MRNPFDETLHIPRQAARDLAGFRAWAVSPRFPERGRIDFLAGDLEVDMSPEELHTHGLSKTEIATALQLLVARRELGHVYIDRARISSPAANFSVEPDVVVAFWTFSRRLGLRFRLVRREVRPGRWIYRLEHDPVPDAC